MFPVPIYLPPPRFTRSLNSEVIGFSSSLKRSAHAFTLLEPIEEKSLICTAGLNLNDNTVCLSNRMEWKEI